MTDKAIQTTVYENAGKTIGQVGWKPHHGHGSDLGHRLNNPGDFASGHQGSGTFYPPGQLPAGWGNFPTGILPIQP